MSSEKIEAVISDFGGVLTSPLLDSFMAFQNASGISLEELGAAMRALSHELGTNPLFELETGRMTEARFLELLSSQLSSQLGREVALHGFGEQYFEHLHPNEQMIGYDARAAAPAATSSRSVPTTCASGSSCGAPSCRWTRSSRSWSTRVRRHAQTGAPHLRIDGRATRGERRGGAIDRRHRGQLRGGSRTRNRARSGFGPTTRRSPKSRRGLS